MMGTEENPASGILLNYDNDDYSQGYGQIKEVFRALAKDDMLNPYLSDHDFRSSNNANGIGYNLYVFDIRNQKNLECAQPIKVEFNFSENVSVGIYGYAVILTN